MSKRNRAKTQNDRGNAPDVPHTMRLRDRVRVTATNVPAQPTPGYGRTLREAIGLTEQQFAERVGVDKMTVARWEWGKVKPGAAAVTRIEKVRREAGRRGVMIAA